MSFVSSIVRRSCSRTFSVPLRSNISTRAALYNPQPPSDPFPLPLSKELTSDMDVEIDTSLLPSPLPRTNESISTLRARLVYQSRKRGTLETDLLLSTFAKQWLSGMSEAELREFDKLLDEPDWDIYYWSIGKKEPPERWKGNKLLDKLRVHARNEGKVVRRMPELGVRLD